MEKKFHCWDHLAGVVPRSLHNDVVASERQFVLGEVVDGEGDLIGIRIVLEELGILHGIDASAENLLEARVDNVLFGEWTALLVLRPNIVESDDGALVESLSDGGFSAFVRIHRHFVVTNGNERVQIQARHIGVAEKTHPTILVPSDVEILHDTLAIFINLQLALKSQIKNSKKFVLFLVFLTLLCRESSNSPVESK